MRQGGLGQKVKGGIVVNDVSFQDAAVTVIGILAKTYIGYNRKVRYVVLNCFGRFLNNTVFGIGARCQ